MPHHVVLLGDSILDNGAYVQDGPDVSVQLRTILNSDWQVSLLAVDGSTTNDIEGQLDRLPSDATHLVVSAGGNDALMNLSFLEEKAQTVAGTLRRLAGIGELFERSYSRMLSLVLSRRLATTLCTIYYPRFPEAPMQSAAVTALLAFNDVICRSAFREGLPLIDLRLVCSEAADYANWIEPSVAGGEKIASTIRRVLTHHDFRFRRPEVFV